VRKVWQPCSCNRLCIPEEINKNFKTFHEFPDKIAINFMASGKISEPVKVLKAMSKRVCSIRKAYTILHSKAWMTQKFAYT